MDALTNLINKHIAEDGQQFTKAEVCKALVCAVATTAFLIIVTSL